MGEKIVLTLDARDVHGKKVKTLRQEGLVPVVVYGAGMDSVSAQIAEGVFNKAYKNAGKHTPVTLNVTNKKRIAMIKEVDIDPVSHRTLHVSFHAVKANEPVVTEVPINLIGEGESDAEKEGLVILQALEQIEIRALPMELPDALEVSIVHLKEAGERVTVADIQLPEGVELVERTDGRAEEEDDEERPSITDLVIASVYEPSALQAANEAAGGDATDESDVESEHGEDTPQQGVQDAESRPGGKGQDEPKQSNVDAGK